MIIHCQFTIGTGQNDATPTVVMGVVDNGDPLQGDMVEVIKALVTAKLCAMGVDATTPSRHLGFSTPVDGE